jgi:hypothetical protein
MFDCVPDPVCQTNREMIVERACDDLVGGPDDRVRLPFRQPPALGVDQRARLLDDAIGARDLDRHAVAPDREMMQRPLRLRPPVAVRGHRHVAHAVELAARAGSVDADGYVAGRTLIGHAFVSGGRARGSARMPLDRVRRARHNRRSHVPLVR